jgi:type III secretion protein U
MSEKNLPPSQKRLQDARKKGDVAKSGDITSAATFIGALLGLWLTGERTVHMLQDLWGQVMRQIADPRFGYEPLQSIAGSPRDLLKPVQGPGVHQQDGALADAITALLINSAQTLVLATLPLIALVLICAVMASFFQVGGLLAWQRLNPDMNRLNPAEGLKRLFSTRSLIDLAKAIVKTLLMASVVWLVIQAFLPQALQLGYAAKAALLALIAAPIFKTCTWAVVIFIVMAGVDYVHQRFEFIKQNRMSKDELRQEHKDQQGDPMHQSLRKSLHFEILFASLSDRMNVATAVVHSHQVAVALYYAGDGELPVVIARGQDELAQQIKRHAQDLLIPFTFDGALAHRLYDEVRLDQYIPKHLFKPVARLLQWAGGDG